MTKYKYTENDFKGMRFRVDKIDVNTYDPRKSFPEIKIYYEYTDDFLKREKDILQNFGKIFAYIVFAYDMKSPFVIHNTSILKRKKEALLAAGFTENRIGRFPRIAEKLISNESPIMARMIIRFVRLLRSSAYATLVGYQEALYRQTQVLILGGVEEKKNANITLRKNTGKEEQTAVQITQQLTKHIEELTSKLLVHDTEGKILSSLYDSIETDDLNCTPEEIAAQIHIGETPKLYNPVEDEKKIEDWIRLHLENLKPTVKSLNIISKYNDDEEDDDEPVDI